jgi:predicted dehydrogenase
MDKVRVGVIGTSWWADAMHLPALKNHPQAEIAAICGRNPDNLREMQTRWDIPQGFTDWQAMITNGGLDALIVSTANDTHYPISMAAMEAGLHVLCEKPIAMTYPQAAEMAQVAAEKQLITLVPFTYSYMPTARYLKELISSRYIGKPYHLNMRYYTGYARKGDYMWRFDLGKAGAGVSGDLGAHFLYIAQWLYGEITSLSAVLGYQIPRPDKGPDGKPYELGDDSAIISLQFASGAQGVIHVTAVCYEDTPFGQTHHMEFHGSEGTLYSFTDWDTVQQVSGARVGEGRIKDLPIPESIWNGVRHDTVHNTYRDIFRTQDLMTRQFITGIAENRPVKPDFQDGASVQRLIDAIQISHRQRRWVDVNELTN